MSDLFRLDAEAQSKGRLIVRMVTHDVMTVLTGRPIVVTDSEGGEVIVRLYSAEEWLPLQHAAADLHGAPRVDMARAVELTRPLQLNGEAL